MLKISNVREQATSVYYSNSPIPILPHSYLQTQATFSSKPPISLGKSFAFLDRITFNSPPPSPLDTSITFFQSTDTFKEYLNPPVSITLVLQD